MAERPDADATPAPGGVADALIPLRFAGYCVLCDRIVERCDDGTCPQGHPAEAIAGRLERDADGSLPALRRFNLAALLIPPVWGPAHGQWVGAVFLPIWLFADSIVSTAGRGGATSVVAVLVVSLTLAFQVFFARRANGLAFRRVADHMSVGAFTARQRVWAIASVPAAIAIIAWVVWAHVALAAAPRP